MPNRKISQLPQTSLPTTLEDTDRLPLARAGNTFHILGSDIKSPILSQAQSTMLTKVNSLSARDSATIDLSFSSASYVLSANVRDDSISTQHLSAGAVTTDKIAANAVTTNKIAANAVTTDKIASEAVRYSNLASWQSLSASPTLSAEAITQRLARAWVIFDGTLITPIAPAAAHNISAITKNGTGDYTLNFINAFSDTNYILIGDAGNTVGGNGLDGRVKFGVHYLGSGGTPTLKTISQVRCRCVGTGTDIDGYGLVAIVYGN